LCPRTDSVAADAADPLQVFDRAGLWALSRGEQQTVAVIDTGVTPHPRLAHLIGGGDYVSTGDGTQDCDGHGTMVAGIIAATVDPDYPERFAGIAPAATVLTIRQSSTMFAPADGSGQPGFGDVDTMARAVRTAADAGATVINISAVACAAGPLADTALGAALAYAVDVKNIVVVAAAGNSGGPGQCPAQADPARVHWDTATVAVSPAWYDDYVLTVGSVGPTGAASPFSMAGPWVDVAAPGEQMVSLNPAGSGVVDSAGGAPLSGTSYAAPVVAGLAALIRSRFPELTARQVTARIESTARHRPGGWDPVVGNGIIDPLAALGSHPVSPAPGPQTASVTPDTPQTPVKAPARARMTAVLGAAISGVVLVVALCAGRSRRSGAKNIMRD